MAEFDTDDGPTILECWSMEPSDAAKAFSAFFLVDHPNRIRLSDQTRLAEHLSAASEAWKEIWNWWKDKPVWTGDYVELVIDSGTQVTIGETVIKSIGLVYVCQSKAFPSRRDKITETKQLFRRNRTELEKELFRFLEGLERTMQSRKRSGSG